MLELLGQSASSLVSESGVPPIPKPPSQAGDTGSNLVGAAIVAGRETWIDYFEALFCRTRSLGAFPMLREGDRIKTSARLGCCS